MIDQDRTSRSRQRQLQAYRSSDIDQGRPRPLIPILLRNRMTPSQPTSNISSSHERPCNVRAELDGDAERDDEIDERDGVEGDVPDTHHAHHIEDGESTRECDDSSSLPRAEEERGDEKDSEEGKGKNLNRDRDDVSVLKNRGR